MPDTSRYCLIASERSINIRITRLTSLHTWCCNLNQWFKTHTLYGGYCRLTMYNGTCSICGWLVSNYLQLHFIFVRQFESPVQQNKMIGQLYNFLDFSTDVWIFIYPVCATRFSSFCWDSEFLKQLSSHSVMTKRNLNKFDESLFLIKLKKNVNQTYLIRNQTY